MAEKWDKQLMDFLKRTGDDLKTEAQRLFVEVQDPNNQAKVKEGLQNLRVWAMATGKQAAEHLESAVRRVEETVEGAFDKRSSSASPPPPVPPASRTPSAPPPPAPTPPVPPEAKAAAKAGASKSIGRKKPSAKTAPAKTAAKKPAAKKASSPKSIGRKKPARPAS
ncbi:transcriptional regulator [Cystobacter fuscus]|uniref:transcriptional regulator n=1 Tax=Cystobacter fuscus TaxID=43 RepID=UPI002B2F9AA8|nr:transcriptional regulator [Cystobacter fuscus]